MDPVLERLIRPDMVYPVLVVGALVATSMVKTVVRCINVASRERTRREIAAYIAEGSLTPEQGERLMNAKEPGSMSS